MFCQTICSKDEPLNNFQKVAIFTGIVAAVAVLAIAAIFASPFLPMAVAGAISSAVVFCGGVPLVPMVAGGIFAVSAIATLILSNCGSPKEGKEEFDVPYELI